MFEGAAKGDAAKEGAVISANIMELSTFYWDKGRVPGETIKPPLHNPYTHTHSHTQSQAQRYRNANVSKTFQGRIF
jgi:hypothetical protein